MNGKLSRPASAADRIRQFFTLKGMQSSIKTRPTTGFQIRCTSGAPQDHEVCTLMYVCQLEGARFSCSLLLTIVRRCHSFNNDSLNDKRFFTVSIFYHVFMHRIGSCQLLDHERRLNTHQPTASVSAVDRGRNL
jgi:hypothetical protein